MPFPLNNKRDSSGNGNANANGKTPLCTHQRWTGRFGKYGTRSSDQDIDENDGGDSEQQTSKASTSQSHGPLQPRLGGRHQATAITLSPTSGAPTREKSRRCFTSHAPPPTPLSASSDKAIFAFGGSSSTGDCSNKTQPPPYINKAGDCVLAASVSSENAIFAQLSSTSGCAFNKGNSRASPRQTPLPTPSTPTRCTQCLSPRSSRAGLETPKSKTDDDASWGWWFLASISESFDTLQTNVGQQTPQERQQRITAKNLNLRESPHTTRYAAPLQPNDSKRSKMCYSVYELPSVRNSDSSSQQNVSQSSVQHFPVKEQTGGEYTLKEQQIRKEALTDNALGGTLNYDQQASAPYYFVPTQHASIVPNESSDTEQKTQFSYNVEWTPQDSSYGAAIPAFGWIPQRKRKLLEVFFLLVLAALLIVAVVKTGIKFKSSGSGGGEETFFGDDDHYEAFSGDSEDRDGNDGSESHAGDK